MSKFALDFEVLAMQEAISRKFDVMVCGHVHQPQNRIMTTNQGSILYLNSGDWVENLTALEYENNIWKIVYFTDLPIEIETPKLIIKEAIPTKVDDKVLVFDLN
jgi:predicted phosphodiesterase